MKTWLGESYSVVRRSIGYHIAGYVVQKNVLNLAIMRYLLIYAQKTFCDMVLSAKSLMAEPLPRYQRAR